MSKPPRPFALMEVAGVELEYMIVDRTTLGVLPIGDYVLQRLTPMLRRSSVKPTNELVMHVLELRNPRPVTDTASLLPAFQRAVTQANDVLAKKNAMLMGGGVHPWMKPARDTHIWPHENNEIYQAYHRIFDCRGHGWSNLQSAHLNLSFGTDEEFGRLHAAVRLILPIIPALSAASPILDGKPSGLCDTRLEVYRTNQARIPSLTGSVIPEAVFSIDEYHDTIFKRMYRDIAPHDPDGTLQDEWLNSRGAIARFQRNAIEIRVVDAQEAPHADITISHAIRHVVQRIADETWAPLSRQKRFHESTLWPIMASSIRSGSQAVITDAAFLRAFGIRRPSIIGVELWRHLLRDYTSPCPEHLDTLLGKGTLAERLLVRFGHRPTPASLRACYRALATAMERHETFV